MRLDDVAREEVVVLELERSDAVLLVGGIGDQIGGAVEPGDDGRADRRGALAVGRVAQEAQRLADRVRVVRRLALERGEAEGGRAVEPLVADAEEVQPAGERRGRPCARLVEDVELEVRRVRVEARGGEQEGDAPRLSAAEARKSAAARRRRSDAAAASASKPNCRSSGWLSGQRLSGSSPWPRPPSSLGRRRARGRRRPPARLEECRESRCSSTRPCARRRCGRRRAKPSGAERTLDA